MECHGQKVDATELGDGLEGPGANAWIGVVQPVYQNLTGILPMCGERADRHTAESGGVEESQDWRVARIGATSVQPAAEISPPRASCQ